MVSPPEETQVNVSSLTMNIVVSLLGNRPRGHGLSMFFSKGNTIRNSSELCRSSLAVLARLGG
jgi:hypothetical protein